MENKGHSYVHNMYLFLFGHGEEDEGKLDYVGDDLGLQISDCENLGNLFNI